MLSRSRVRVAVVVLAACASFVVTAQTAPAATTGSVARVSSLEAGVLADMNALRRSHGLVPLRISTGLAAAARRHSLAMAAGGFFQHESANGSAFWKRVQRYYKPTANGYWSVGENLLWSSPDVDANGAIRMWLDSAPHRKNLLTARWREVGISAIHATAAPGVFRGLEVTIVTADFGVRR